ncbi:GAF domain-containing protein [Brevibacterium spongiae]|uniref:GAF domain-containing protein n=1 Tax=Brevibacterium spongiae TaxID=2909672 RepID=A0ABY5SQD3_9MICO|nr:GAF domain-containing protein [Brevibacterium spongiae]UVI36748.1 GAF domain-containing protein [Brevibacterium spongiae]
MLQPDLAHLARDLTRIHDAVIAGASPPVQPRALVRRSWDRMLRLGLDPAGANRRIVDDTAEVESRRQRSKLRLVVDEMRSVLLRAPDAAPFILVVTDADGVILWRDGAVSARRQADDLGFVEGAHWAESTVGTNAIGTALTEEAPVQLFSAEHFESTQHPWYCSAVPVHDPDDGTLLGVVDISGPAMTLHPAVQSLVTTAVRLAEARLMIAQQEQLNTLRDRMSAMLAGTPGPALVVDDAGWVAYQQGVRSRDRIEVPAADRSILIPGAGLCRPEKITGGWLLRPAGDRRASVTLRTSADPPVLEIHSGDEPFVVPLTPRRAQILAAVTSAGPSGITTGDLSRRLHGDCDHVVTVRAEVSRLRRSIGAMLATRPYRWADGVSARVE